MKIALLLPFISLLLASLVSAHGYLASLGIGNKNYTGNVPNADPNPSVIRQVDDIGPVKGASNPYLNCGLDAQFAEQIADANPGDTLQFDWRGGGNSNWPHNTGPMLTYMTSCGSTSCSQYNSSSSKWFKIAQVGRTNPGGDWAQQSIMNGAFAEVILPSNIAPGNYILRHEIIALHLAQSMGGAEFYPACAQVKVSGGETGQPTDDELVLLPGAYKDSDPGIYDPNVYDTSASYTFPGPPIAAFIGDTGSSGSSSTASTSATTPSSTAAPSTSTPKGVCKLQRRTSFSKRSLAAKTSSRAPSMRSHPRRRRFAITGLWKDMVIAFGGSSS